MNVILRTACGCERVVDSGDASEWNVALSQETPALCSAHADPLGPVEIASRKFRWRGRWCVPTRVLEEVRVETTRVRPDPPIPFTAGEWADAVARFRGLVRGDVPQLDAEFIRRHGGANIICHEKSGTLIGAFYPAPGWAHSEEAVALFSSLRALMEER